MVFIHDRSSDGDDADMQEKVNKAHSPEYSKSLNQEIL
jgi:hypothetical protein